MRAATQMSTHCVGSAVITNEYVVEWMRYGKECCMMIAWSSFIFLLRSRVVWGKVLFNYLSGWKCAFLDITHKKSIRYVFFLLEFSRNLDSSPVYTVWGARGKQKKWPWFFTSVTGLSIFKPSTQTISRQWKLHLFMWHCEVSIQECRG